MKALFIFVVSLLCFSSGAYATHLRSGEITVRQDNINSLKVWITITVFTNTTNTNVLFGGDDDFLDFGDGSDPDGDGRIGILIPETQNTYRTDLSEGVAVATYTVSHTYQAPGVYTVTYSEPNRNEGILNMDNSVNTRFYTESQISLEPGIRYESPTFLTPPIFNAVAGEAFSLSVACRDTNNYKLFYEIVTPKRSASNNVDNYQLPQNFKINAYNGLLTWDGKFNDVVQVGEYIFAVKVYQVDNQDNVIGYVIRDFQIIISEADISIDLDDNLEAEENNSFQVPENDSLQIKTIVSVEGVDSLNLTVHTELPETEITFLVYDTLIQGNEAAKVGLLTLKNSSNISRETPYAVIVRAAARDGAHGFYKDITYLYYTQDARLALPSAPVNVEEQLNNRSGNLYPNPVSHFLFLESEFDEVTSILDAGGKQIAIPYVARQRMDMSSLQSGIYLVEIKSGNKRKIIRVSKN